MLGFSPLGSHNENFDSKDNAKVSDAVNVADHEFDFQTKLSNTQFSLG
jgi:hypothetical protein